MHRQCLSLGALLSATDPVTVLSIFSELRVNPNLFYIVFGESVRDGGALHISLMRVCLSQVFNDAVAVALFQALTSFRGGGRGAAGAARGALAVLVSFSISFVGSAVLGLGAGLVSAWLFKSVDFEDKKLVIVAVYIGLIFVPYLLAGMRHAPPPLAVGANGSARAQRCCS